MEYVQDRFKSKYIEDECYLMSAIGHIHQNPKKHGIGSFTYHEWSSYGDYTLRDRKLIDVEEVLNMILSSREEDLTEFCRLNSEGTEATIFDIG